MQEMSSQLNGHSQLMQAHLLFWVNLWSLAASQLQQAKVVHIEMEQWNKNTDTLAEAELKAEAWAAGKKSERSRCG